MGTKLAQVLEQQGRRRDWLAEQTGVSPATVTRIAKGERRPSPEFRVKAAAALGVDEDDLFPEPVAA